LATLRHSQRWRLGQSAGWTAWQIQSGECCKQKIHKSRTHIPKFVV